LKKDRQLFTKNTLRHFKYIRSVARTSVQQVLIED
jgi:hypothetical protein